MTFDTDNGAVGIPAGAGLTAEPIVRLHPDDDVVIARHQLVAGMRIGDNLSVHGLIPAGHSEPDLLYHWPWFSVRLRTLAIVETGD